MEKIIEIIFMTQAIRPILTGDVEVFTELNSC